MFVCVLGWGFINFNPLPLYRGRRVQQPDRRHRRGISIHSLFTEGDTPTLFDYMGIAYFNPLPLYRGRQRLLSILSIWKIFQSTPSLQRETYVRNMDEIYGSISIHSLFTEGDQSVWNAALMYIISIHSLFTEGDTPSIFRKFIYWISIHSLFTEGDQTQTVFLSLSTYFNPLPLYRGRRPVKE